ncbi:MAG TPA: DUF2336 domain-containing protein [Geminicoccaceae bacterium]|nr:DUF2336 domain-containing protein [Geminicoccaceae bacterium]
MSAAAEQNRAAAVAGRRRSELLRRGAEAAQAERLTMADVVYLQANRDTAARAAVAAKFGQQFDALSADDDTSELAGAILQLLVRDVAKEVRRSLAETIAGSPNLPPGTAGRLARDDIDVARPMLERSPVLRDEELADIVRTHAMQYALAVAGRESLSEVLSDVLAETGHRDVAHRLAGNAGAKLSVRTMKRIAEDHRGDREIEDRLVRRPALSYEMVERLAGIVAGRLEWELVREQRLAPELARQIVTAARERATLNMVAREHGRSGPERELHRRHLAGELGPEDAVAFLRAGDIAQFEAGMALLAGLDTHRARRLLYSQDRRHLAAVCVRAGFPVPLYLVVRMALELAEEGLSTRRGGGPAYTAEGLRFIHEQYERIGADEGQLGRLIDG